jgi:hypothetical protein
MTGRQFVKTHARSKVVCNMHVFNKAPLYRSWTVLQAFATYALH